LYRYLSEKTGDNHENIASSREAHCLDLPYLALIYIKLIQPEDDPLPHIFAEQLV
jgi:hypothetical protein